MRLSPFAISVAFALSPALPAAAQDPPRPPDVGGLLEELNRALGGDDEPDERAVMEEVRRLRRSDPVEERVARERFEFVLRFYGPIRLESGAELPWTEDRRQPYVRAARRWLQVIRGVRGKDHHRMTLNIVALPFPFGNGAATPDYGSLDREGGRLIPTAAEVMIHSFLLDPEVRGEPWVRNEEYHNALHEFGHALGIGSMWNVPDVGPGFDALSDMHSAHVAPRLREWAVEDPLAGGMAYRQPRAVAAFQRVMGTDLPFVPIGGDGGHLFALYDEEQPRVAASGVKVPEADLELMSHRNVLSEISVGFLDDLGYDVDYAAADPYTDGEWRRVDLGADDLHPFFRRFDIGVDIFGVRVFATRSMPEDKLKHVCAVLAEYLDNDEDGVPDNPRVIRALREAGAAMILTGSERELDRLFERGEADLERHGEVAIQPQWATETRPGGAARHEFDVTFEEVFHLITHYGYAAVYPEVFGEMPGSKIAKAMDQARGGHFERVPDRYPEEAWYTYDDETCDYPCQVTEYFYWGMTSLLGAQAEPWREAEIAHEWRLNTPEKLREGDPALYALLSDPWYALPRRLPDGNYEVARPPE